MGFLDKVAGAIKSIEKVADAVNSLENMASGKQTEPSAQAAGTGTGTGLVLAASTRLVAPMGHQFSFRINDSFKDDSCGAGEVSALCSYDPEGKGAADDAPYIALVECDEVRDAIKNFRATGKVPGAIEMTPLTGQFLFKAKINYYGRYLYFYAPNRPVDYYIQDQGFCASYPQSFGGTQKEADMKRVLDDAASTYTEQLEY